MNYKFQVPANKQCRIILNTDAKNEADDQYAIAHALLTPSFQVKGIIGAHFTIRQTPGTMEASVKEAQKIVDLLGLTDQVPVVSGAPGPIPDVRTPIDSAGARLIIDEAMKDDPVPLYVLFIGTLTDLACALLLEPAIAGKMTAVWAGGGAYPNGHNEFNLINDIHAANVVFESDLPLWQIPMDVTSVLKVSLAELQYRVEPCGEIGHYLFEQLVDVNNTHDWPAGEMWVLWDVSVIGVLLDKFGFHHEMKPAPSISPDMHYIHHGKNRSIRVYSRIEPRFILDDFYAKLALYVQE